MPGTMTGVSNKLASIKSIDSTPETFSALICYDKYIKISLEVVLVS